MCSIGVGCWLVCLCWSWGCHCACWFCGSGWQKAIFVNETDRQEKQTGGGRQDVKLDEDIELEILDSSFFFWKLTSEVRTVGRLEVGMYITGNDRRVRTNEDGGHVAGGLF